MRVNRLKEEPEKIKDVNDEVKGMRIKILFFS